ncbi:hypothetical protein KIPB_003593 [Kipferlia bialata]|uniref:Uncharacterized protein n=1 Tax=Kipferlia bialata TaxID=797122 RepID=A0A9K3GGT4_9EUKA|nr:hypothetical protein KIPB_003593 [Kipferlia bialata]|eukprot:g3593.t1
MPSIRQLLRHQAELRLCEEKSLSLLKIFLHHHPDPTAECNSIRVLQMDLYLHERVCLVQHRLRLMNEWIRLAREQKVMMECTETPTEDLRSHSRKIKSIRREEASYEHMMDVNVQRYVACSTENEKVREKQQKMEKPGKGAAHSGMGRMPTPHTQSRRHLRPSRSPYRPSLYPYVRV